MKEIKIKEKWLYEAMNRSMEKADGLRAALNALADSMNEVNKQTDDLWHEMEKLYKLDPGKRYYYRKKTHSLEETCIRNAEPSWLRNRQLDKAK